MSIVKTHFNRRSFLKVAAAGGAGLMLQFSWMPSLAGKVDSDNLEKIFKLNGFIKIDVNGDVTIFSPNPEIGQNVKTSMPMIVAEELDVDWTRVKVVQAPLNTEVFTRQLAGGSQSIRQGWKGLRMAGGTARHMLKEAAAKQWKVSADDITTENSMLYHKKSGKKISYGDIASAAAKIKVPEEVKLKDVKDFKIIRTSKSNVDAKDIVTGQPLFGLDYQHEGMLIAMIVHPPAFGMKLKNFNKDEVKRMEGVHEVTTIQIYDDDYLQGPFDTTAFPELIVVIGKSTWQVMKAKRAVKAEWEKFDTYKIKKKTFRGDEEEREVPAGLESSEEHTAILTRKDGHQIEVAREDGDTTTAFAKAAKVIERTYTAPFLSHNTMEPMNFFAHVTADKALLVGPIQTPEFMEKTVSARLGLSLDKIDIQMTRMGGGFGRRLYGHFLVEAAVISQKIQAPVKLVYTREDDMTFGTYRPAYQAHYKAALDQNNKLIALHVRAGGLPESPLFENRFPAGAVDNYLAESWSKPTNITIGAWRAPRSNFMAGVEQAFLDEVAEAAGKDPIDFRLELLEKAKTQPVGKDNDYDPERYAGVLKLVREKSGWGKPENGKSRGVAAYYCHNSYVANVVDLKMDGDMPVIEKVYCAADCGIVVNPIAATNMMEGGTVDALGHSMLSAMTFKEGMPQQRNFDKYKLIRNHNAPKDIEVHFVDSDVDPTGLGEPPFPPAIGALANALYKATGKRYYHQPFMVQEKQMT